MSNYTREAIEYYALYHAVKLVDIDNLDKIGCKKIWYKYGREVW